MDCLIAMGQSFYFSMDVNYVPKKEKPDFDVWCYSGYTFEQLQARNDETTDKTLKNIDVLVDGRFVKRLHDISLRFRGSSNQRVINVNESTADNIILFE